GLKATPNADPVCPVRVRRSAPVAESHTLTTPSFPPEATHFPSGLNATPLVRNPSPCPVYQTNLSPVVASQRPAPSSVATAMRLLSGLKAISRTVAPLVANSVFAVPTV